MGGDILLDGRGQAGFGHLRARIPKHRTLFSRLSEVGDETPNSKWERRGGPGPLLQVDARSAERGGALRPGPGFLAGPPWFRTFSYSTDPKLDPVERASYEHTI